MVAESRSYLSSDARAARAADSLERRSAVRRNENTTRAMQTFRVFVSSPSDVMVERRRVEHVVSRLNGEFAGVARLEAIRWETEFYQAYSTFQAQIPRSTDCDLVIGILRWRLGTELPPDFGEKLPDDRPFPSGTAYEILTAIDKRQHGGKLPDIYVFRFAGSSPSVAIDDPNRARIEHDWQVLKGFFQEWFLTERGHFKAAFNPYTSEDDFETQVEKLLRKWVADKVAGGRVVRWPIEVKGSPFCGLAAFGAKHAPVFFGRSDDTARAVDLWREPGAGIAVSVGRGRQRLGKVLAGPRWLDPRLMTPGVITEVMLGGLRSCGRATAPQDLLQRWQRRSCKTKPVCPRRRRAAARRFRKLAAGTHRRRRNSQPFCATRIPPQRPSRSSIRSLALVGKSTTGSGIAARCVAIWCC